jgi:hypothetical protein
LLAVPHAPAIDPLPISAMQGTKKAHPVSQDELDGYANTIVIKLDL